MKKRIQKYLSGSNEGFSLVELIIVIAIMAILVGVVALAVIPNLERSRESKDLTTLDSACSALSIAVANAGSSAGDGKVVISAPDSTGAVTVTASASNEQAVKTLLEEQLDLENLKLGSGMGSGKSITLEWATANGANVVKAYADTDPDNAIQCKYAKADDGTLAKLIIVGGDTEANTTP